MQCCRNWSWELKQYLAIKGFRVFSRTKTITPVSCHRLHHGLGFLPSDFRGPFFFFAKQAAEVQSSISGVWSLRHGLRFDARPLRSRLGAECQNRKTRRENLKALLLHVGLSVFEGLDVGKHKRALEGISLKTDLKNNFIVCRRAAVWLA